MWSMKEFRRIKFYMPYREFYTHRSHDSKIMRRNLMGKRSTSVPESAISVTNDMSAYFQTWNSDTLNFDISSYSFMGVILSILRFPVASLVTQVAMPLKNSVEEFMKL